MNTSDDVQAFVLVEFVGGRDDGRLAVVPWPATAEIRLPATSGGWGDSSETSVSMAGSYRYDGTIEQRVYIAKGDLSRMDGNEAELLKYVLTKECPRSLYRWIPG